MSKLKDIFLKNILLKIISLVFAIVIWLLIVNIDNPNQTRNFTTNVEVINSEVLTAAGRYYTIPEGQNTVTFGVTAPRNVIERLSSSDFLAVADMNNLEEDSRIPIDITARNYANSITISSNLKYLNVEVGEEMTEKFIISPVVVGEPAGGFVIDSIQVTPNVVTVTGADKLVSSIKDVKAVCDVSGMSTDISENVITQFLDGSGERIDTTKLDISATEVTVNVMLTNYKEVPIRLEGYSEDNEQVDSLSIDPESVSIRGSSSIINDMTAVYIPASVIDVENLTEDVSTTVDITRYLPEGVKLMDESQAQVKVEITLYGSDETELLMPVTNITVRNLGEDLAVTFNTEELRVKVRGITPVLDSLDGIDITGSIDLRGLGVGSYTVRFVPDQDDRYEVVPTTVRVNIASLDGGEP